MTDETPTVADFLLDTGEREEALSNVETRADQLATLAATVRAEPSEAALQAFKACFAILSAEMTKALVIEEASQEPSPSPTRKPRK